jgi:hypothetical protein
VQGGARFNESATRATTAGVSQTLVQLPTGLHTSTPVPGSHTLKSHAPPSMMHRLPAAQSLAATHSGGSGRLPAARAEPARLPLAVPLEEQRLSGKRPAAGPATGSAREQFAAGEHMPRREHIAPGRSARLVPPGAFRIAVTALQVCASTIPCRHAVWVAAGDAEEGGSRHRGAGALAVEKSQLKEVGLHSKVSHATWFVMAYCSTAPMSESSEAGS